MLAGNVQAFYAMQSTILKENSISGMLVCLMSKRGEENRMIMIRKLNHFDFISRFKFLLNTLNRTTNNVNVQLKEDLWTKLTLLARNFSIS